LAAAVLSSGIQYTSQFQPNRQAQSLAFAAGADIIAAMKSLAHQFALAVYRRLPGALQRFANRCLNTTYGVASKVLLTTPDGRFLVVKQTYRDGWDLPGGFIDRGENPQQAAYRELREETGLTGVELSQQSVVIEPDFRMVQVLFHGQVTETPALQADGVEISAIRWVVRGDVPLTPAASEALTVMTDLKVPYHVSSCEYYR